MTLVVVAAIGVVVWLIMRDTGQPTLQHRTERARSSTNASHAVNSTDEYQEPLKVLQ